VLREELLREVQLRLDLQVPPQALQEDLPKEKGQRKVDEAAPEREQRESV
jgi:hypothetical protein